MKSSRVKLPSGVSVNMGAETDVPDSPIVKAPQHCYSCWQLQAQYLYSIHALQSKDIGTPLRSRYIYHISA